MTRRVLVLFPDEWDRAAARDPRFRGRFEFLFEGFDLFSFPDNARLFTFDALAFVDKLARRYAGRGIDAVVTSDEQFGPFLAALVAERLGHERRQERPELLVGGHDRIDTGAGVAPRHLLDEAERVEGEEARVVGEAEEVEALVDELVAAAITRIARGRAIPFVGEEHQNAPGHRLNPTETGGTRM